MSNYLGRPPLHSDRPNRLSPRFLLPRLHLDRLWCQVNVRGLRRELAHLPTKLYETYDEAMSRIHVQAPEDTRLALRALSWISKALRPLTIAELQHALAIQPKDKDLDEEGLVDEKLIVLVSAELINIDTESETTRLVHFTLQRKKRKVVPRCGHYYC